MRVLSGTLETDQKKAGLPALVRIVLTGANTYTYYKTRILDINHTEEPYSQRATVTLDNSDKTLTALDYKGYSGVISYGITTSAGDVYSPCAPLTVIGQQFESSQGRLVCRLELIGIPNLMAEDRASGSYVPTTSDADTVKDLIRQIAGDTGVTMMPVFNHCTTYNITFDSEDTLIDVYEPQDGFRIYTNGSRLAAIRRLLDFTKCVMRAEDDGKLHILEPTITSDTYKYEYKLLVADEHTFFSKAYRKRLVIPNYIVCQSNTDDYPQYSGVAEDATSYALVPKRQYINTRLADDDQGKDIATAVLSKYQLHAEMGAADVPMNCGAEVFDYVKVTDSRENDNRIGNLGHLTRHWNAKKKEWRMTFSFGGWLSVRGLASDLQVYPDGLEQNIKEMFIENLYAQYIYAQMIDVDYLSALTAQMGLLLAGEIRLGTGVLDPTGTATGGSQTTLEDSGASWTPDEWIGEDLRVVIDGVAYTRAISDNTETELTIAALPAGVEVASGDSYYLGIIAVASGDQYFIKSLGLLTATGGSTTTIVDSGETWATNEHADKPVYIIKNGYRYERTVTSNTADTLTIPVMPDYVPFNGLRLWYDSTYSIGRIAGYVEGVLQYYTGSDGYLYAGGGNVILNADGVSIYGDSLFRVFWDTTLKALISGYETYVALVTANDIDLHLATGGTGNIVIQTASGYALKPIGNLQSNLGTASYRWNESRIKKGYFGESADDGSRLRIPVGTDMYD